MMAIGVANTLNSVRTPVVIIIRENTKTMIVIIQRASMNIITQRANIIMINQRTRTIQGANITIISKIERIIQRAKIVIMTSKSEPQPETNLTHSTSYSKGKCGSKGLEGYYYNKYDYGYDYGYRSNVSKGSKGYKG